MSAPRLQLIGAFRAGLDPVKSTSISLPWMRTVTQIGMLSSVSPSPSMTSLVEYSPSGSASITARARFAGGDQPGKCRIKRGCAVLRDRLQNAAFGDAHGRELGVNIAQHQIRQANILGHDPDQIVKDAVVAGESHARQPQPFLKHRSRVGWQAAGDSAADIEQMRNGDGVSDDLCAGEDRPDDREIASVRAAFERVIGQEGIARRHIRPEALDDKVNLTREGAGKNRNAIGLRDEIALRIADATGKIEDFVDDRTHRGARQHDRHFARGRKQLAADHFAGYGVGLTIRCGNRIRGYGGHVFFLVGATIGSSRHWLIVTASRWQQNLCHPGSIRQPPSISKCFGGKAQTDAARYGMSAGGNAIMLRRR